MVVITVCLWRFGHIVRGGDYCEAMPSMAMVLCPYVHGGAWCLWWGYCGWLGTSMVSECIYGPLAPYVEAGAEDALKPLKETIA